MIIQATYKTGEVKRWRYDGSFAIICLAYFHTLQQEMIEEKIHHLTLIKDDGSTYIKKGLKLLIWKNYTAYENETEKFKIL